MKNYEMREKWEMNVCDKWRMQKTYDMTMKTCDDEDKQSFLCCDHVIHCRDKQIFS
jgi:hypothetical protein